MTAPTVSVLDRLDGVKQTGSGWQACCPAHDDSTPSLSVSEGDDGRVLVKCHAGCAFEEIVDALGVEPSDLFPADGAPRRRGFTVEQYARRVGVPPAFLRTQLGVRTHQEAGRSPVVAIPYYDASGAEIATRYRTAERFWWPPGTRPPLYGLERLADAGSGRSVLLVEGESDTHACAFHGVLAVGVPGASSWRSSWTRHLEGRDLYLWHEPDQGGDQLVRDVADDFPRANVVEPPDGVKDPADLNRRDGDAFRERLAELTRVARPIRKVVAELDGASVTSVNTSGGGEWQEPIPLGPEPPSDLSAASLPSPLREHVASVAASRQTPTALPLGVALAAVATAVAGKAELRIRSDWIETLNVYVAGVIGPANRKSAVESELVGPIREWEADCGRELGPKRREAENRLDVLEQRLANAKRAAAKASSSEEEGKALAEIEETERRIEELEVPTVPRLLTSDVTEEALGRLMADQHGRAAILSSEGDSLRIFAGRYSSSGAPSLELLKKGHTGDAVRVDRVGREGVHVRRPLLTVGLTLQPALLRGLSNREALDGEGVLARFLWLAPPSLIGERLWGHEVPEPDADARRRYHALLDRLLRQGPARVTEDVEWEPYELGLTADARDALFEWWGEVETMLGEGGRLAPVEAWGGKLVGNTARVAGLLHIVERAGQHADPFGAPISARAVEWAVEIARSLIPHALHVLTAEIELDPELALARYVLGKVREGVADPPPEEEHLTVRWLHRLTQGKVEIRSVHDVRDVLRTLEGHGYVRIEERESRGGQRPSPWIHLNPKAQKNNDRSDRSRAEGGEEGASVTSVNTNPERDAEHTPEREVTI